MKRNFYDRLKKLEKNTFDGNTLWCVRVEAGDRWTPYEITTDKGVERQRLHTKTGEAFLEWQNGHRNGGNMAKYLLNRIKKLETIRRPNNDIAERAEAVERYFKDDEPIPEHLLADKQPMSKRWKQMFKKYLG